MGGIVKRSWLTKAHLQDQIERLEDQVRIWRKAADNWQHAHSLLFEELKRRDGLEKEEAPTEHELRSRFRNLREREERLTALERKLAAKQYGLAQIAEFGRVDSGVVDEAGDLAGDMWLKAHVPYKNEIRP